MENCSQRLLQRGVDQANCQFYSVDRKKARTIIIPNNVHHLNFSQNDPGLGFRVDCFGEQ